jgi:transaldolase
MIGQSVWLDHITRDLIDSGTLERYIAELEVTGLTSNPTIYSKAIGGSDRYDRAIAELATEDLEPEAIFFNLAIADLRRAAAAFATVHQRTAGLDGFVSLEVSPLLAHDTAGTVRAALALHEQAGVRNMYIKIPGTAEGIPAIEEVIAAGVPVNVTLLFSTAQYLSAVEAYVRGIERRVEAGMSPDVSSVASVFVSRWDAAVAGRVPPDLHLELGTASAGQTYAAYRRWISEDRWLRLANHGARPQRVLWASTAMKDPAASDVLYVDRLAVPFTVNTMPEATLLAAADHARVDASLAHDRAAANERMSQFEAAGIVPNDVARRLQREGVSAFAGAWTELMETIRIRAGRAVTI